jgi:8-oxo-dGTP pyrophosphatase MutT (NUDIX family)
MTEATIPEFGTKRENEERRDGGYAIVFDPSSQKYAVAIQPNGRMRLFSGGVDEGETLEQGTLREVTEEGGLYDFDYVENMGSVIAHYYNSLKNVNRVAHADCFLVILKSNKLVPVKLEDHETFALTWVTSDELLKNFLDFNKDQNHDHWIYSFKKSVLRAIELGYDITSRAENFS